MGLPAGEYRLRLQLPPEDQRTLRCKSEFLGPGWINGPPIDASNTILVSVVPGGHAIGAGVVACRAEP
jgi:hypothetical protein